MTMSSRRRRRVAGALLTVARVGQAQMLFGNLYEAVVRIPHRFAHQRDLAGPMSPRTLLRPGNPTFYFVPSGPITVAASLGALAAGSSERRWLAASAAATTSAAAVTGYVVRRLNVPLFFAPQAPPAEERDAMLRRWYRLNALRIAVAAVALTCAERATTRRDG